MAARPRQPPAEENEDWLLGYLATTAVGKDPKLNLATQKIAQPAEKKKSRKAKGAVGGVGASGADGGHSSSGSVTSILGIRRGTARRSSWTASPTAAAKISQAVKSAVPAVAPLAEEHQLVSPGHTPALADTSSPRSSVRPAASAACPVTDTKGQDGTPQVDAVLADQHASTKLAFLQAGSIYHKKTLDAAAAAKEAANEDTTSPSDNFHKWAASAAAAGSSRRMSSSGGGLRPQGGGGGGGAEEAGATRRMSTSRISMSGRRQSMDYSELDAVKQRLQHAATLWAVADDEDEGETDEEEDEVGDPEPPPPPVVENNSSASSTSQKKSFLKMFSKGKG